MLDSSLVYLNSIHFLASRGTSYNRGMNRGHLVLRHSVPHFLSNSGGVASSVAKLNAALASTHKSFIKQHISVH